MMLNPYQHGVVREITENGKFDPANPLFQNYPYVKHDLNELEDAEVIDFVPRIGVYISGPRWSEVK